MFSIVRSIFFAFLGLLVAGLLSWQHLDAAAADRLCGSSEGCAKVLTSPYSQIKGIPIAYFGAGLYAALLLATLAALSARQGTSRKWLLRGMLAAAVLGTAVSAVLMAIQFFVIRGFCPLCTLSALLMFMLALTLVRCSREVSWDARPGGALGLLVYFVLVAALGSRLMEGGTSRGAEIIARIDGKLLTLAQMSREPETGLPELESQIYQAKRDWVERKINETVVEAEAKRRGMEIGDLIEKEINQKVRLSEEALQTWYQQHTPTTQNEEQSYLTRTKAEQELRRTRFEQWVKELRRGHNIQVLLRPPPGKVLDFDRSLAHCLGPEDATVKLVLYSDFQCPYCCELEGYLEKLLDKYPFEVSLAWIHLPLENHELAMDAALAAEAAAEQGRFWFYHDRLIQEKGEPKPSWEAYAKEVGLDIERFRRDMKSPAVRQRIEKSVKEGLALGLDGVPALYMNGRYIGGLLTFEELTELIKLERKKVAYTPAEKARTP